jgi:hypothetical protein
LVGLVDNSHAAAPQFNQELVVAHCLPCEARVVALLWDSKFKCVPTDLRRGRSFMESLPYANVTLLTA